MFVVTVDFNIHPEFSTTFKFRVLQQARDSLDKETDCIRFDVCIDPNQANRFYLYEVYENESAFSQHLQSDHFLAFDQDCQYMIQEKVVQTFTRLNECG